MTPAAQEGTLGTLLPLPGMPGPAPSTFTGPAGSPPVIVSWGLGVDSSAFLALVLGDRQTQPMYQATGYDPASMIVVHAVTGDVL